MGFWFIVVMMNDIDSDSDSDDKVVFKFKQALALMVDLDTIVCSKRGNPVCVCVRYSLKTALLLFS